MSEEVWPRADMFFKDANILSHKQTDAAALSSSCDDTCTNFIRSRVVVKNLEHVPGVFLNITQHFLQLFKLGHGLAFGKGSRGEGQYLLVVILAATHTDNIPPNKGG